MARPDSGDGFLCAIVEHVWNVSGRAIRFRLLRFKRLRGRAGGGGCSPSVACCRSSGGFFPCNGLVRRPYY